MAFRSIIGLLNTLEGLRRLGEDISPVLARYGLDLDRVDPAARIDRGLEFKVLADIAGQLRDPLAGLKTGMQFGLGSYGPFFMLLMTCPTIHDAFRAGVRYQQLTFLWSTIRFEPGQDTSDLVFTPPSLPPKLFRFRVDGEMSGTWKLARDLQLALGIDTRPVRVDMPYPKPPEARAYEEMFGCPVHWGNAESRFRVRNTYLHLPLPTADATAQRLYRAQCDLLLHELNAEGDGLAGKVSAHLALFTEHYPTAAEVASALGMGERSFRRLLGEEGTSFRALLDGARFDRARQLLANSALPVDAIARQLGYAEAASFIHAFRRWSGDSPAAWRRGRRAGTSGG